MCEYKHTLSVSSASVCVLPEFTRAQKHVLYKLLTWPMTFCKFLHYKNYTYNLLVSMLNNRVHFHTQDNKQHAHQMLEDMLVLCLGRMLSSEKQNCWQKMKLYWFQSCCTNGKYINIF